MKRIVHGSIVNHSALNLCMVAMMVVGFFSLREMNRESFPEFELDRISISVPYPGAAPEEVERGVAQKIEEAVRSIEGIKRIRTTAQEGACSIRLDLIPDGRPPSRVLEQVRSAVDRITSFPLEAEEPQIAIDTRRRTSINVGIVGTDLASADAGPGDGSLSPQAELRLRQVAENVRELLLGIPEVAQVDFLAARDYQIDIEIPEETLRRYGLSMRDAAEAIRRENQELPAGTIRSQSQEVLLRGNNRRTIGSELAELPLVSEPGGGVLTVGDLAVVRDEFADTTAMNFINGKPALALSVQRSSSDDLFTMIDAVQETLREMQTPPGYKIVTWGDESVEVRGRLKLLINNGFQGLIIVFVLLMLFLDPKLAFWVAMGIPFALLASGVFLYATGQTLNQISMFAFVMALGIVVDDAIVVGENIFAHRQMGKSYVQAAIDGTVEVIPSVFTAVLTTAVAFAPLLFVAGTMGKFTAVMPAAILVMLFVSLVECVTILPCHLAHRESLLFRFLGVALYAFRWLLIPASIANRLASGLLDRYVRRVYRPSLAWCLRNRSVVVALCAASLTIMMGLKRSGWIELSFFPKVDGNTLTANVTFPDGTPEQAAMTATQRCEDAFWEIAQQYEQAGTPIAVSSYRVVGASVSSRGAVPGGPGGHRGSVEVELIDAEDRQISSRDIVTRWRDQVGTIVGTEEFNIGSRSFGPGGTPIEFKLQGPSDDVEGLDQAVQACKTQLARYPGVSDIQDDSVPGKWEYRFRIKPEAFAMGVRTADLAETVRAAYYGEEVMRVQRGRHEVKILVIYPRQDRRSLAHFDQIRVRLGDGIERPITELAEIDVVRGYAEINRVDQARSITVSADLDEKVGNADRIVADLKASFFPDLRERFPSLRVRWEGQQERRAESFGSLFSGFAVALLVMYILLAIEFKSSVQPLLVMLIIPFGAFGAAVGHLVMGLPLTLFSFYGIIALTGIVVNDSIVLIDFINSRVRSGVAVETALEESGARRFRPVMLTTITTVGGLIPIMLETSIQAQILIPMATSIAFGEIFATAIVLYIVPVSYSLYHSAGGHLDVQDVLQRPAAPAMSPESVLV